MGLAPGVFLTLTFDPERSMGPQSILVRAHDVRMMAQAQVAHMNDKDGPSSGCVADTDEDPGPCSGVQHGGPVMEVR